MRYICGVVLSAHRRIIIAMETGGLYDTRTLHTLFLRMVELLHVLCLSLSSHTALNPAVVWYSLYSELALQKGTIPLLVLNPYRNTQQRVASMKKFSKFSESTFDSLPASAGGDTSVVLFFLHTGG